MRSSTKPWLTGKVGDPNIGSFRVRGKCERVRTPTGGSAQAGFYDPLRSCPSATILELLVRLFQGQTSFVGGLSCVLAQSMAAEDRPPDPEI